MTDHLPNFLIVGAAKSGTTSLYYYLHEHPEIFLSAIKEPKFFSSEVLKDQYLTRKNKDLYVGSYEEYRNLFRNVQSEKAIGEASTDTLFLYGSTIPRIKKYLGDPKIIVILRNPPAQPFPCTRIWFAITGRHFPLKMPWPRKTREFETIGNRVTPTKRDTCMPIKSTLFWIRFPG